MLANLFIFIGMCAAFIASLDLFLSDAQKNKVSDVVLYLWDRLDDVNEKYSYIWTNRDNAKPFIGAVVWIVVLLNIVYGVIRGSSFNYLVINFQLQLLSIIIIFLIINFTLSAHTILKAVIRITMMVGIPVIIFNILSILLFLTIWDQYSGFISEFDWTIFFVAAISLTSMIAGFWLLIAGPIIILFAMKTVLSTAEFIARRLSEYPKGPIIGGGVLLAFFSAVYKAFQ